MASGKLLTKCAAALNVNRLKRWDILVASDAIDKGTDDDVCHGQRFFNGPGSRPGKV